MARMPKVLRTGEMARLSYGEFMSQYQLMEILGQAAADAGDTGFPSPELVARWGRFADRQLAQFVRFFDAHGGVRIN